MAVNITLGRISEDYDNLKNKLLEKIYLDVTGLDRKEIRKEIVANIIKDEKEQWEDFIKSRKNPDNIDALVEKEYSTKVNDMLTEKGLWIRFVEDVVDGEDIIKFEVLKIVKEYTTIVKLDYTLETEYKLPTKDNIFDSFLKTFTWDKEKTKNTKKTKKNK